MSDLAQLSRIDRIIGCLTAGARGDAIGAFFEGHAAESDFALPDVMRFTDDTQLTIATCEAILEAGHVAPDAVAQSFVRWHRQGGIRGIGASTLKALRDLDVGCHWALAGATGEHAAGNGAAMRIAPLAIVLNLNDEIARQTLRDVCRITHRNDEAYIGALALARTLSTALGGRPINREYLSELVAMLPDSRVRDRLMAVSQDSLAPRDYVQRFAATGFVVDSVPLAILMATENHTFLMAMQEIIALGGDTDSIGAMFGQIHGARFGVTGLPLELLSRVEDIDLVKETATEFATVAASYTK